MALAQRVTVFETFNRAKSGQKVAEDTWDNQIIPKTASRLKEKYGIAMDPKVMVPTDEKLIDNLFRAGLEMLVECGIYCMDTGRVIKYTEEEVWASLAAAPKAA